MLNRQANGGRFGRGSVVLAVILCFALLLSGCTLKSIATEEPQQTAPPQNPAETIVQDEKTVTVTSVDEFLAALGSGKTIVLSEGQFNLSTASDYGKSMAEGPYTWETTYDGYQLVIRDLEKLEIRGSDSASATLSAVPRYANVLTFRNCRDVTVSELTAGHTEEPGFCCGGVLEFDSCERVFVDQCALFGCGTLGVNALRSREILVSDSVIYECSYGAASAMNCYDVRLSNCEIRDCGTKDPSFNCFNLLEASGTTGFAIVNCSITGNNTDVLLDSDYSTDVCLLGCGIRGNQVTECAFDLHGDSPMVEGCCFEGNTIQSYYRQNFDTYAVNQQGEDLITFDFNRMEQRTIEYDGPQIVIHAAAPEGIQREDGTEEYHVTTVDEFLSAIGPNRTIYLEGECFDLSEASGYGAYGGEYYTWYAGYDGPGLSIINVRNLHLVGQGKDSTELTAVPMYADVLRFTGGENISVENMTAGHKQTGDCGGDVFYFESVTGVHVTGCGMYGCGVWGVRATDCRDVSLDDCEIYSCNDGAVTMMNCVGVSMSRLDIHDMPYPENASFYLCDNVVLNGTPIPNGSMDLNNP